MNALGHAQTAGHEEPTKNQPDGTPRSHAPIRIVIADDSEFDREMLKMVLEAWPGLQVLGSVGDGCQALEMVAARRPQLVLDGFISKRRLYPELPRGIAEVFPDSATGNLAKGQWAE